MKTPLSLSRLNPATLSRTVVSPQTTARALTAAAATAAHSSSRPGSNALGGKAITNSSAKVVRTSPSATAALSRLGQDLPRRAYSTPVDLGDSIPSSSLINVTTLPNKVRVATEETPGHFSAVGVYVDAGSRYEDERHAGVSHLLDRLAFKSTTNRTVEQMTKEIEALGGNVMCSSSRETIMYQSSMFNQDLPQVLSLIADTILNPSLLPAELEAQRAAAAYEISEIWSKPEMILPEVMHHVAFQGNTLGNPLLCPAENLDEMDVDRIREFVQMWYRPERIVVAGAGVSHGKLVELSEKLFGSMKGTSVSSSPGAAASVSRQSPSRPLPSSAPSVTPKASSPFKSLSTAAASFLSSSSPTPPGVDAENVAPPATFEELAAARARYTGGELYMENSELEFTHVYVAFEGLGIHDDDIYALATLHTLLGGGGSFSAGGPGKGMYSRLYTNVLNQFYAVDYCAAFHHVYADSGLFGISASVSPQFNGSIVDVIAHQLELLTGDYKGGVTQSELNRAKNQLKSSLVMALESRLVEVEDLGRQVQVHGRKVSVEEMCERIDQVDLSTLRRVASRVLRPSSVAASSQPLNYGLGNGQATVVAQGKLEGLGDVRATLRKRGLGA